MLPFHMNMKLYHAIAQLYDTSLSKCEQEEKTKGQCHSIALIGVVQFEVVVFFYVFVCAVNFFKMGFSQA